MLVSKIVLSIGTQFSPSFLGVIELALAETYVAVFYFLLVIFFETALLKEIPLCNRDRNENPAESVGKEKA